MSVAEMTSLCYWKNFRTPAKHFYMWTQSKKFHRSCTTS